MLTWVCDASSGKDDVDDPNACLSTLLTFADGPPELLLPSSVVRTGSLGVIWLTSRFVDIPIMLMELSYVLYHLIYCDSTYVFKAIYGLP